MARYDYNTVFTLRGINAELEKIKNSIDTLDDREGTAPNERLSDTDQNSFRIYNLPQAVDDTEPVRLKEFKEGALPLVEEVLEELDIGAEYSQTLTNGQTQVTTVLDPQFSSLYISDQYTGLSKKLVRNVDYTVLSSSTISLMESYPSGSYFTEISFTDAVQTVNVPDTVTFESRPLELIAHRGFRNSFPQDTMLAFSSAARRGANSLECDVQVSSDGVLYVFHDDTIDALTDGTGAIKDLTSAYIDTVAYTETAGTFLDPVRIPKFEELLSYVANTGIKLYAEIKEYRTQADVSLIVQAVQDKKLESLVQLSSFVFSDLTAVRAITADIEVGYLNGVTDLATFQGYVDDLAVLGNSAILQSYASALSNGFDYPEYARANGVDIAVWTVNTDTEARQLMSIGINKIMSDIQLGVV